MLKKIKNILCLLAVVFLWAGCKHNPLEIDVSTVRIEPVHLNRFDKDFFALTPTGIHSQLSALQKKHPGFASLFINNIICRNGLKDSACIPEIIKFINEKDVKETYAACEATFSEKDFAAIEKDLDILLRHYHYYFPEEKQPLFYTMMSGFYCSVAFVDSSEESNRIGYGISLEMYLGNTGKIYSMLRVPQYKRFAMRKENIPSDIAKALLMKKFEDKSTSGTLLSEMIYQGKLLYLVNAMMPNAQDSLLIGFSANQLAWCSHHEKDMWGHLIENKFLYSNQKETITKFTGEGPFTTGFVKESPARTGVWIGWNIVKKFMKENPATTLTQLMNEPDAQIILSKSKYKP
jgi:hypothetical protein